MPTILIITKNYPPAICGVGDHTAHLKRELTALGNKVIVLTGTSNQQDADVFTVQAFDGGMYQLLKMLIAEEQVDCILWQYVPYSYQRKGLPFWWPLLMLRLSRSGVKQFVFFHEVSLRWWGYGLRQLIVASGQMIIANLASLIAGGCFTSIPLYAGYFVFKKPGIVPISANIMVSSQWSVVSEGKKSSERRAASGEARGQEKLAVESWQLAEGRPGGEIPRVISTQVFCFANRADRALLQAVKNINEAFPVKLVLGGMTDAGKKAQLVSWIGEFNLETTICFTGTLALEALAAIINASTIFIQPQIVERKKQGGISAKNGTVMAAMAMGKPIITCEGDMTDNNIFRHGENMLLVPYGDAAAYEKAILRLLKDPTEREKLGIAAAANYQEHCSWEVTSKLITQRMG